MNTKNLFCREIMLDSQELIIPRTTYQRTLNEDRVRKIAAEFDERIANEPKVSSRSGCYYVFDGQHTIAARKFLNGGRDLPIRCKVFYGLSERDEALLFAQQTGASANLTAGARFRALVYGGDKEALAFLKATETVGLCVDCKQAIVDAWKGDPDSLRAETVVGCVEFVDLYHGEYSRRRLVTRLRQVDPVVIFREGRAMTSLPGYKRYLYQVYRIYNGSSAKTALPMKF